MSHELHILRDLLAGQSTADSIAPQVNLSTTAATAILVTLKREGLVDSYPLAHIPNLHVYRLTHEGKARLKQTN